MTSSSDKSSPVAIKKKNERLSKGDLNELWDTYHRFVKQRARYYSAHYQIGCKDLEHEGFFGLITAKKKFDPSRGVQFLTYAIYWVNEAMLKYCYRNSYPLRIPPRLHQVYLRWLEWRDRNEQHENVSEDVIVSEIKAKSSKNYRLARNLFDGLSEPCSPDLAEYHDAEGSMDKEHFLEFGDGDIGIFDEEIEEGSVINRIRSLLPPLQFYILWMREVKGMQLSTIGQYLSLSREYVRQLHDRALLNLRAHFISSDAGQDI